MAQHVNTGFRVLFVLALAVTILPTRGARTPPPAADLFDDEGVVRINITIPTAGMRVLRGSNRAGTHAGDRPETRATVTDGRFTYKDVAIKLKGAMGSFRPLDDRPGLTLKFDKHVKGQSFHGLEKLSLNNSVQDSTFIAEKIGRELFEKAGIPVPRADYAVVTLNGRNLGLYVLVEGYDKQFLRRYFKNVSGNLYDGGFCEEITRHLNVNSGDHPEDQSDLRRLVKAASDARENNRLADLEKALDVDRFITMIATEVLLCHWDGYAMNRNNYRVFSDKESGRMVFMPHGLDQLFGVGGMGVPHTPIFPQMNGLVARAVVGTTEGRSRYRMKLAELRTNLLNTAEITARIRQIESRIQPVLAEVQPHMVSRHRAAVNSLSRNVSARASNLDEQLRAPAGELKFSELGTAQIMEGWNPRLTAPGAKFDSIPGPDGTPLLLIRADPGRTSASFRTRVVLPRGQYRFEGRFRTHGIPEHSPFGATLRISGARDIVIRRGESDWVRSAYTFEVIEPIADIELICELRGNNGSVWFDASSLKLTRLRTL